MGTPSAGRGRDEAAGHQADRSWERPYGDLVTTSLRVTTWNLWGRLGPWQARQPAILSTLRATAPDVIALQECWVDGNGRCQTEVLVGELGGHEVHSEPVFLFSDDWGVAFGLVSRWPIARSEHRDFDSADSGAWGGAALFAELDGPRGPVCAYSVGFDWPPHGSATRQASARQLADFVESTATRGAPVLVCGDLNAPPDADEVRALVGRSTALRPGFALVDAWEAAAADGPGHTWSNANEWAAPALLPGRRIDYILVGRPGRAGVGHVVSCVVDGTSPVGGTLASDHYAVTASIRY